MKKLTMLLKLMLQLYNRHTLLLKSLMMTIFKGPKPMLSPSRMINTIKLLMCGLPGMMSQGCSYSLSLCWRMLVRTMHTKRLLLRTIPTYLGSMHLYIHADMGM